MWIASYVGEDSEPSQRKPRPQTVTPRLQRRLGEGELRGRIATREKGRQRGAPASQFPCKSQEPEIHNDKHFQGSQKRSQDSSSVRSYFSKTGKSKGDTKKGRKNT
jgi:hypothetical protein